MDTPLKMPDRLTYLIENGHWPTEDAHFMGQDFKGIIAEELVQAVFPGERRFCFAKPPFRRVADMTWEHEGFWNEAFARPEEIDRQLSILIGDFELGTDSAVILDYSANREDPCVRWLCWGPKERLPSWREACSTFDEFADRLQLERLHFPKKQLSWWTRISRAGRKPKSGCK